MKRIPQPAVNPALRDREAHDFWGGFVVALIGVILVFGGVRHVTGIETVGGDNSTEIQLMRAYSFSGLQFPDQLAASRPPEGNDLAALDRWMKKNGHAVQPSWKVRVDLGAKTACPT
jgi:hypothetical protein